MATFILYRLGWIAMLFMSACLIPADVGASRNDILKDLEGPNSETFSGSLAAYAHHSHFGLSPHDAGSEDNLAEFHSKHFVHRLTSEFVDKFDSDLVDELAKDYEQPMVHPPSPDNFHRDTPMESSESINDAGSDNNVTGGHSEHLVHTITSDFLNDLDKDYEQPMVHPPSPDNFHKGTPMEGSEEP